jgi:hypothetical protein
MAKSSAPICFRVTEAERAVLETVAWHVGESLSEFIRTAAIKVATGILQDEGAENLMGRYAQSKRQEADAKIRSVLGALGEGGQGASSVTVGRRSKGSGGDG